MIRSISRHEKYNLPVTWDYGLSCVTMQCPRLPQLERLPGQSLVFPGTILSYLRWHTFRAVVTRWLVRARPARWPSCDMSTSTRVSCAALRVPCCWAARSGIITCHRKSTLASVCNATKSQPQWGLDPADKNQRGWTTFLPVSEVNPDRSISRPIGGRR